MIMWVMSDRGLPRSYATMQGFGVNTFTFMNAAGERHFVKFHWIPELGVHSLVWDEALKLNGQDPDFHRKGLEEAITNGAYPKWFFGVQVIPESKQDDFEFDILDATKIWPEELVPVEIIGEMELNRVVDEYFVSRLAWYYEQIAHRSYSLRLSRSRSRHPTSCPVSASRTTRFSRAVTSRTTTPSSRVSASTGRRYATSYSESRLRY
jgi:hypothetical protein